MAKREPRTPIIQSYRLVTIGGEIRLESGRVVGPAPKDPDVHVSSIGRDTVARLGRELNIAGIPTPGNGQWVPTDEQVAKTALELVKRQGELVTAFKRRFGSRWKYTYLKAFT